MTGFYVTSESEKDKYKCEKITRCWGWVLRAVPGQQKQQIVVAVTNESGVVGCGGRSALLR